MDLTALANGFVYSPYTQLGAGLLAGGQPGGSFAGGLNLGLANVLNMQRQQAATALVGEQIRQMQAEQMAAAQRAEALRALSAKHPEAATYWAAGMQPPTPPSPQSAIAKLQDDLTRGFITPEQYAIGVQAIQKPAAQINIGQEYRPAPLTPQEKAQYGIAPERGAYFSKSGEIKQPPQPTVAEAAAISGIDQAKQDLEVVREIYQPGGKWDKKAIATAEIPTTQGHRANSAMRRAIEVVLRIRSGGAVPQSEVDSYLRQFSPNITDSDAEKSDKLRSFEQFIEGTEKYLGYGGRGQKVINFEDLPE